MNATPANAAPLVSVIIVVYNQERWMRNCLDSVCAQTYENLEIIIVDDCSSDRSVEIAEQYAHGDARIKIVRNRANLGVGLTRNAGLDEASGDFIGWVDPDDTVDIAFFEKLVCRQRETNSDIVMGSYTTDTGYGKIFLNKVTLFKFESKCALMMLWGGIYSARLIRGNNVRFPDLRVGEDIVFSVKCVWHSNHISTCPDAMYFYEQKKSDSLTRIPDREFLKYWDQAYGMLNEWLGEIGEERFCHSGMNDDISALWRSGDMWCLGRIDACVKKYRKMYPKWFVNLCCLFIPGRRRRADFRRRHSGESA